jgi:hypothetical protein
MRTVRLLAVLSLVVAAASARSQQPPPGGMTHTPGMRHTPGMQHDAPAAQPTQGGQAAFAAISEIVKLLEADPATDWAKVDLEALRQHLIDMELVTMRARVRAQPTADGLSMEVTGEPVIAAAIRRMVGAHAAMLESAGEWRASTSPISGGLRFVVVAARPADTVAVARIRGLGFIGILTQGDHHRAHHLMIAKGAGADAHRHGMR